MPYAVVGRESRAMMKSHAPSADLYDVVIDVQQRNRIIIIATRSSPFLPEVSYPAAKLLGVGYGRSPPLSLSLWSLRSVDRSLPTRLAIPLEC